VRRFLRRVWLQQVSSTLSPALFPSRVAPLCTQLPFLPSAQGRRPLQNRGWGCLPDPEDRARSATGHVPVLFWNPQVVQTCSRLTTSFDRPVVVQTAGGPVVVQQPVTYVQQPATYVQQPATYVPTVAAPAPATAVVGADGRLYASTSSNPSSSAVVGTDG
jgi:hypothetical protein